MRRGGAAKALLFCVCLVPLGVLFWRGFTDRFSANPVEDITHFTGDWTLYFLLITLTVTPLRRLFRWNLVLFRRMLGLYAFFYACLHFSTYLVFDHFFDLRDIVDDIVKRPYITVGFTAFVLLIPLAATSNNAMIRRLKKHWRTLHRLVYLIAVLGILHYLWLVKADVRTPVMLGIVLGVLLALRSPYLKLPRRGSRAA